jgi:hypothetical protein
MQNIVEDLTHRVVETGGGSGGGGSKITEKANESGYSHAEQLGSLVKTGTEKCPALNSQFEQTFGEKKANLAFSAKVKNAEYDLKSNTIYLPFNKEPNDLLDGIIFETCNVGMQQEFEKLNKQRSETLKVEKGKFAPTNPISLRDFSRTKSDIEAMSTLKDCQIKTAMVTSGVPIALQGKKNIASVYRDLKKVNGETIPDFDELLKDEKALDQLIEKNQSEIKELFQKAEHDPATKKALYDLMASTPHKSNVEPHDTGNLKTQEMYAFETISSEANTSNFANILLGDLQKQTVLSEKQMKDLSSAMKNLVREFELPYNDNIKHFGKPTDEEHLCRVAMLAKAIKLLRDKFGQISFPGMDITDDMEKLANVRMEKSKKDFPYQWKDDEKEIDFEASLNKAFNTFIQKLSLI